MRTLPPVHSPVRLTDLVASGFASLANSSSGQLSETLRERYLGEEVALTDSGTHALQFVLELIRETGDGQLVVGLPAYSCFDLVTAAVGADVRIRFYDVDPISLAPNLDDVRRVSDSGVDVIVGGNLHAFPIDWACFAEAVGDGETLIVEDAAQGIGAERPPVSAQPAATVLSFGRGKGWTGGGGGAAVLRGRLARSAQLLPARTRGGGIFLKAMLAWLLGRPSLFALPSSIPWLRVGETHYKEPSPVGPVTQFSTHLVLRSGAGAHHAASERQEAAARWLRRLGPIAAGAGFRLCQPLSGLRCGYLRLPVLAPSREIAARLVHEGRRFGVARGYPVALHKLDAAQPRLEGRVPDLPGAETLAAQLVTLPTHGWVDDDDVEGLMRVIQSL